MLYGEEISPNIQFLMWVRAGHGEKHTLCGQHRWDLTNTREVSFVTISFFTKEWKKYRLQAPVGYQWQPVFLPVCPPHDTEADRAVVRKHSYGVSTFPSPNEVVSNIFVINAV